MRSRRERHKALTRLVVVGYRLEDMEKREESRLWVSLRKVNEETEFKSGDPADI